jgi:hypothetical protein
MRDIMESYFATLLLEFQDPCKIFLVLTGSAAYFW